MNKSAYWRTVIRELLKEGKAMPKDIAKEFIDYIIGLNTREFENQFGRSLLAIKNHRGSIPTYYYHHVVCGLMQVWCITENVGYGYEEKMKVAMMCFLNPEAINEDAKEFLNSL